MRTLLFSELRDGDRFQFSDHGTVYEYRGNGFYNVPYSGGPWHVSQSDLKYHGRVVLVDRLPELIQADEHNARRGALSYPPIEPSEWFLHRFCVEKPLHIYGWQWSTDFGRWSAFVEFEDGWRGFTYPRSAPQAADSAEETCDEGAHLAGALC